MTLLVRVVLFKSARLKMERSYSCDLSIQPRCTVYVRSCRADARAISNTVSSYLYALF